MARKRRVKDPVVYDKDDPDGAEYDPRWDGHLAPGACILCGRRFRIPYSPCTDARCPECDGEIWADDDFKDLNGEPVPRRFAVLWRIFDAKDSR